MVVLKLVYFNVCFFYARQDYLSMLDKEHKENTKFDSMLE